MSQCWQQNIVRKTTRYVVTRNLLNYNTSIIVVYLSISIKKKFGELLIKYLRILCHSLIKNITINKYVNFGAQFKFKQFQDIVRKKFVFTHDNIHFSILPKYID